jgi:hypothetical protein
MSSEPYLTEEGRKRLATIRRAIDTWPEPEQSASATGRAKQRVRFS